MATSAVDQLMKTIGQSGTRRTVLQALGASAVATGTGLAMNAEALGKPGKKHKKKKRKSAVPAAFVFTTRVEVGPDSDPLPVTAGQIVDSIADCGGPNKVVSCGYEVDIDATAQIANLLVQEVIPFGDRDKCRAVLARTADAGSVEGARIRAVAICLV